MKTHFADVERGNESYPYDEWGWTACGLLEINSPKDNNWDYVDCKNCLKQKEKYEKDAKSFIDNDFGD